MMKRIIVTFVFTLAVLPLIAGGNINLNIANDYFSRLAYTKAASYYEKYLEKNEEDVAVWQKLATCYELTNAYESLAATLETIVQLDGKTDIPVDASTYLSYGNVLMILGKKAEAAKWYEKYLSIRPDDRRAANQLAMATAEETVEGAMKRYDIVNMEFNTADFEYGPNIFNSTLLYTSTGTEENTGKKINQWTGDRYSDIRQFEREKTEVFIFFNEVEEVNTAYNDGIFTIDPLNEQFYYTRNNYNPNKTFKKKGLNSEHHMNLKIYVADNDLGRINDIREFRYNSEEYNTAHPTISRSGKYLVFVSDQPDSTAGGRDLYYCKRDSAGWTEPVLLTTDINTEGDELFPVFHQDGSLYFSSDGLGSMGGLDIFRARIDFESNSLVSLERLKADINSTYDDFAIVFDGKKNGYFTSDRPGGAGKDDIYSFEDLQMILRGTVVNQETGERIPFADASVTGEEGIRFRGKADADARFETTVLRHRMYDLFADSENFYEVNDMVSTSKYYGDADIEVVLELIPVKYTVRVVDAETKQVLPGVKVDISMACTGEKEFVITGLSGSHGIPVHSGCGYNFVAKTSGYLASNINWQSPAQDADQVITIELEKIHFAPITLRNIYYDFDDASLRLNESTEDLNKLYGFLKDNPELTIRINSHTDARGSRLYNEGLSQRRAQSVVDYLLARGVDGSRLFAKGFGENQPVNRCTDGVKCSEEEHQLNRRTELQVVNADGTTKIASDARDDVKVVPCKDCPF